DMLWPTQIVDRHNLSLQIPDCTHVRVTEELIASQVHAAKRDERYTGVKISDDVPGSVQCEVCKPRSDRATAWNCRLELDILDVGEALDSEERFRHILRGKANRWDGDEPEMCGLWWRVGIRCRLPQARANQTSGGQSARNFDELAPGKTTI